jgi:hypothetical protein
MNSPWTRCDLESVQIVPVMCLEGFELGFGYNILLIMYLGSITNLFVDITNKFV